MSGIEFPYMRDEVISAVRSLSDPEHQSGQWGVFEPGVNYYDDLSLNVHVLYDDTEVLPNPDTAVGTVLFPQEVPSFERLEAVLGPLLDLGDRPDADYVADPGWQSVIDAARAVLLAMEAADHGAGPGA